MPMTGEVEGRAIRARKRKGKAIRGRKRIPRASDRYREGDRVDFKQLLFHPERDYLITKNKDKVRAEQLKDKVLILYFVTVEDDYMWVRKYMQSLVNVYNELLSYSLPLEVVFVAVTDEHDDDPKTSENNFNDLFSIMPWTAIPFSDSKARFRLEKSFLGSECGIYIDVSFVISQTGVVLHEKNAHLLMRAYGAAAFPFSKERIQCLILEDEEAKKNPSLKNLLVSPERDYVINNKGDEVSICDLKDKVVALLLYEEGWTVELTETLRDAYKHLVEEKKMNFEVVLIYISDSWHTIGCTDAKSFRKVFKTMPWLAIPYNDRNVKKVMRLVNYPIELGEFMAHPSLLIIGPHGDEFFEPCGSSILKNFGIDAYPWTSNKVCTLQVEKVQKLNLNILWGLETVFMRGRDSKEVKFSDINVGKRIVVFSDYTTTDEVFTRFRMKLYEKYLESQGTDYEFEVIHLFEYDDMKKTFEWLKLHPGDDYEAAIKVFCDCLFSSCGILVFDVDGKIVRATSTPTFRNSNFPFYSGPVEEEVVEHVEVLCRLDEMGYIERRWT